MLESTLDLIRQVLLKHETAVIAEFRAIIEAKNHELRLIYTERDNAVAELSALRSGESVVVPREPTEEMKHAGARAFIDVEEQHSLVVAEHVYRAMLAASKGAKK